MTYSFTYNDEGIRTSKSANGNTTTYYYSAGLLIGESDNTQTILYIYDAEGVPIGMRYRTHTQSSGSWTTYWFEKNMFGDVVAVYNSSGTKFVSYKYDAWGNFTTTTHATDSIGGATKTPFRYRGYYYDSDLGFYVTGTRYYDCRLGRFINADGYVSTGQGLIGNNMYAYCNNNPISNIDPSGESLIAAGLILLAGAVIGGIAGGLIVSLTAEEEASTAEIAKGIAVGSAIGVSAAGLVLAVGATPYIIKYGASRALFLGTSALRIWALGSLAYNVMPMIILPLFGMEGETIEPPEPYKY